MVNNLIFFLDNDWREPRKHLNFAFNLGVLKGFIPIFSDYTKIAIKEMKTELNGPEFDLLPYLAKLTYRTVSGKVFCFVTQSPTC